MVPPFSLCRSNRCKVKNKLQIYPSKIFSFTIIVNLNYIMFNRYYMRKNIIINKYREEILCSSVKEALSTLVLLRTSVLIYINYLLTQNKTIKYAF